MNENVVELRCEEAAIGSIPENLGPPPREVDQGLSATDVAAALGYEYFGFLLYHSGNRRLGYFLNKHLSVLDQISGSRLALFTLVSSPPERLSYQERIQKSSVDVSAKRKLKRAVKSPAFYNPDRSFLVAQALGVKRTCLPCMIVYRVRAGGHRGFALLKMKDSWFPALPVTDDSFQNTVNWLSRLFDALDEAMQIDRRQQAIKELQRKMDAIARHNQIYKPIMDGLREGIEPVVKLPFRLIGSLAGILENLGTAAAKRKLGLEKSEQDSP